MIWLNNIPEISKKNCLICRRNRENCKDLTLPIYFVSSLPFSFFRLINFASIFCGDTGANMRTFESESKNLSCHAVIKNVDSVLIPTPFRWLLHLRRTPPVVYRNLCPSSQLSMSCWIYLHVASKEVIMYLWLCCKEALRICNLRLRLCIYLYTYPAPHEFFTSSLKSLLCLLKYDIWH